MKVLHAGLVLAFGVVVDIAALHYFESIGASALVLWALVPIMIYILVDSFWRTATQPNRMEMFA